MNNYKIADMFSMLSTLIEIHGENSFKAKSYAAVAFAIEKLEMQLQEIAPEQIASLKGIGASSAQKIFEIIQTGHLKNLQEIIKKTPPGIIEMLNIKGLGPKKINSIWKDMEIESIGELLYACKENRLKLYKGFGEKTQQSVIDKIEFYFKNKGYHLYGQLILIAAQLENLLTKIFPETQIAVTGSFRRQMETIDFLEYVVETSADEIEKKLGNLPEFTVTEKNAEYLCYHTESGVTVKLHPVHNAAFISKLITTSSSEVFLNYIKMLSNSANGQTEVAWFQSAGLPYIPAFLREDPAIIRIAQDLPLPQPLQSTDIRGLIHCHSNWSDGNNTIEEMALAAISKGMEYLVITDHSKSAFYAQGLSEEKIIAQHHLVDELNKKLQPFKIFKSIESDILNDGSLDYTDEVLKTFDIVIASVHSNLKMTEEKAMGRLIKAIENPFTTILGHMTGRLLLSRPGYPVDHERVIDACAANDVIIELNANPNRLDIDWRYISYALRKNVMISIDPDAHSCNGIDDIKYGVAVAQKALVKKENNLSSLGLPAFEAFIQNRRKVKNINLPV